MGNTAFRTAFVAVLLAAFRPAAAADPSHELTVSLANARNDKGWLCVAIYRDGRGYPENSEQAEVRECVPMTAQPWRVRLPSGTYAAAVFHDEDTDGRITKRWLGMPKEGYGFSNDARAAFGPPPWEKAAFELRADQSLVLKLTYF